MRTSWNFRFDADGPHMGSGRQGWEPRRDRQRSRPRRGPDNTTDNREPLTPGRPHMPKYWPQTWSSRSLSEWALATKPRFGSVRASRRCSPSPAGQRDYREDESWTTRAERRGCALITHRGASGGQTRRIGTDPWRSAEAERSCGPRKRRAQRCGRELEPETSRGIRSRAGRSLKSVLSTSARIGSRGRPMWGTGFLRRSLAEA